MSKMSSNLTDPAFCAVPAVVMQSRKNIIVSCLPSADPYLFRYTHEQNTNYQNCKPRSTSYPMIKTNVSPNNHS